MQSTGALGNMDPEMTAHRRLMCDKITQIFHQKRANLSAEFLQKLPDLVRRLEYGLYRSAATKDDYLNMETLEGRLHAVFRSFSSQSNPSRASSSIPVNTMIPTPGMSQNHLSRSSSASYLATSMSNSNGPGSIGVTSSVSGPLPAVYPQAPPSVSVAASQLTTQLMPTPGLTARQSFPTNSDYRNVDRMSGIESTNLAQQDQLFRKQGQGPQNQNTGALHGLGSYVGTSSRTSILQSSRNFPNGAANSGGASLLANSSSQYINGSATSEGLMSATMPVVPDGYGVNAVELGVDSSYVRNMESINLQQKSKVYSPCQGHQSGLSSVQETSINPKGTSTEDHIRYRQQQFLQQPTQAYGPLSQLQRKQSQLNEQDALRKASPNHSSRTASYGGPTSSSRENDGRPDYLISQPAVQADLSSSFCSQLQQTTTTGFHEVHALKSGYAQTLSPIQPVSHQRNRINESLNELDSLSSSSKPETFLPCQFRKSELSNDERQVFHNEFQHRIIGLDEAERPHYSIQGPANGSSISAAEEAVTIEGEGKSRNVMRERQYLNQQRWLLFLRHARRCPATKGKCPEANCLTVQQLVSHMANCKGLQCGYPRCRQSKALVKHYCSCRAVDCPVCVPVRVYISKQRKAAGHSPTVANSASSLHAPLRTVINGSGPEALVTNKVARGVERSGDIQSSFKRMKVDLSSSSLAINGENQMITSHASEEVQAKVEQHEDLRFVPRSETVEMTTAPAVSSVFKNVVTKDGVMDGYCSKPAAQIIMSNEKDNNQKLENMQVDGPAPSNQLMIKQEISTSCESIANTKPGKPKIKGVSLTELFTPEQIRDHINSLKRWVGQSKAKAEKNQAIQCLSENSCQLCAVERLTFDPPPIYCSPCGARIKRNAPYYTVGTGETRHFFCTHCYNESRGDSIEVEGTSHLKARFEKKKNDEETEEWWVQCDKCEAWQHQICALFNGRRNDGGDAEYTCPNCYMKEVENGERSPLPPNTVLGAKDLPRTLLSDHIEQRLSVRLKFERLERARSLGKNVEEVPGVEGLVVRVVSSVDKKLEVKPKFLEIFQEENYPSEFPYKSKVVLLFQKIEGVEVCLFGMYVQEFGSECQFPNHRRVYLSYLDSVKYFRPEIKTTSGEALRTFVYHEILIGYLEYCKKRGFTSCYIWACPPLKGEDYILYCHPEIQKTPKSDKLREWYLSMLRKATKENIVVDLTNLYDHFFVQTGESKAKVTAARLPYFDGDYWPGAAEDMINQLQQEEDDRKHQKKGKAKKTITKRSLKAAGQSDLLGNPSRDFLLMQKLGETILPMKEDFIMVHLQHACSHCCVLMVSGSCWVCTQCKKFQLCDKCYEAEAKREDRDRHPAGSRDKHLFSRVDAMGRDVAEETRDEDEILESEFFDTRQAFLSLCQGNHYQYDTLRRAKHSSMMVLYHLHNPTAPAFVTTCNLCHRDIETGQGWRCEACPDFDVCDACYQSGAAGEHPHRLSSAPSAAERDAQNKEARQKRVLQLRKMLDLLVHAAQCRSLHCHYPNCRKVKGLFRHGINCRTRASGGCVLCKKMWYLLQLHARACKESNCHVPRCRDLREHLRRLQQQSDSRRRAAVMQMMRQRSAEVAAGS
ncbi:histone acetyltransferase of the CBP family 1 isoform X2 [Wolffia australiana]